MPRILCVDDDPVSLAFVGKVLRSGGYDVAEVADGLDAMVAVKQHRPDLVILDIMMPELNGYDVCRAIKTDDTLKSIPVLLLTQRDQELDPRLGALMGVDYLHKPCTASDLLERVCRVFSVYN